MEPLTKKQQKVLRYIEERLGKNSPPSQREMARHFGLSQNAVCQFVGYLKDKDYLEDCGGHRGLRLSKAYLEKSRRVGGIPIVGRVAAGEPILAQENIEGYVDPGELLGAKDGVFVLRVRGESMVEAGILDGDCVVVEPCCEIENGRLGVVLVGDEATVKYVHFQRDTIRLEPANKAGGYKAMCIKKDSGNVRVIGKVTCCFRRF